MDIHDNSGVKSTMAKQAFADMQAIDDEFNVLFQSQYIDCDNLALNIFDLYDINEVTTSHLHEFIDHIDEMLGVSDILLIKSDLSRSQLFVKAAYDHLYHNMLGYIIGGLHTSPPQLPNSAMISMSYMPQLYIGLMNSPMTVVRSFLITQLTHKASVYEDYKSSLTNDVDISMAEIAISSAHIAISLLNNDITTYRDNVLRTMM